MNSRLITMIFTLILFNPIFNAFSSEKKRCDALLGDIHFFAKAISNKMAGLKGDKQSLLIDTMEINNFLLMANMAQDVYRDNNCPALNRGVNHLTYSKYSLNCQSYESVITPECSWENWEPGEIETLHHVPPLAK